jgi:hypothetical protein
MHDLPDDQSATAGPSANPAEGDNSPLVDIPADAHRARSALGPRMQRRFHPSRYQFNIRSTLWLFTLLSVAFFGISLLRPSERQSAFELFVICVCLAAYAYSLIVWMPRGAPLVFLLTAPLLLGVLLVISEYWLPLFGGPRW